MSGDNQLYEDWTPDVPLEEIIRMDLLGDSLQASARLFNMTFMVVDFHSSRIVYHTKKLLYIDVPVMKGVSGGLNPYWELACQEDLVMLSDVRLAYTNLLESFTEEQRCNHVCALDFHIVVGDRMLRITQKFTPVRFLSDGRLWLGLFSFTPTPEHGRENATVFGNGFRYTYDPEQKQFISDKEGQNLSDTEKKILMMSLEGYTSEQISEALCRSVNTIKTHKRRMFEKLRITSISEAGLYLSTYFSDQF